MLNSPQCIPFKQVLLLAAGQSSRMGTPKGLMPFGAQLWLDVQLQNLMKIGANRINLILGYSSDLYFEALPQLSNAIAKNSSDCLHVYVNEKPQLGPFSSLQLGLTDSHAPLFVLPIDTPCPDLEVWNQLELAVTPRTQVVIPTLKKDRGGHPVLLSLEFQRHLLSLPLDLPDSRLDTQIKKLNQNAIQYIKVTDPKIYLNLNTPKEWNDFTDTFSREIL